MKYPKIPLAQTTVALCKRHDISQIVISPGSRNAPLTIGFTHDDFFSCYSIVDERCAGFFALGMAQQLRKPVALVCTSGSALLNYYPAISEAYYSNIPLVVLSADRPKYLIDIGDGQTIKQQNVYGPHVHYSANLKLDIREDAYNRQVEVPILKSIENKIERFLGLQKDIQTYNEAEINEALGIAKVKSGPVHLNLPFDEPLYDKLDEPSIKPKPYNFDNPREILNEFELKSCADIWHNAKRKMVLVGELAPNAVDQKWINELVDDDSVIVFTETTSNLHHQDIFPGIDKIIAPLEESEFKDLQPEVLLTLGGMIVSKKIKAFLRKFKPKHHWHIGLFEANDTFFCLEKHFKVKPNTFFTSFLPLLTHQVKSDYKPNWLKVRLKRREKHVAYLSSIPFSDFTTFSILLKSLPKQSMLQVGNSSAIRYLQLFQLRKDIKVFCNRGTSGIDGSTSTAIGAAVISKERTTFITGDLSFFYDSNALWNNYIPASFRIIVVNNAGGGIFRILPGHKNTENFDTFFETKHNLNAKQLCDMYGLVYLEARNQSDLENALSTFYKLNDKPKLLEVFTPSTTNDEVLLDYFKFIK
ncbi:2-succinyl-5-enolpyruvyl-6-hydroxy-3-cyclohexene-1-carboxylic-acid synthase [uncultured Winogradskyella sp.]|uniref:2-succinyl-5-enolpyruvyl-6-hydroxy-3- cyclohexene-1-carboxylic-acid synthase n=1 Tax=uncultured Winogradskyella sp. TaxID=395353 RepID=UPI003514D31D